MNESVDSFVDDASLTKDLQGLGGKVDKPQHVETSTYLAFNAIDYDGLTECNEAIHDNVSGSNTEYFDCLLLYPAEGDMMIYSGLEHNVSQQFCRMILTNMYY